MNCSLRALLRAFLPPAAVYGILGRLKMDSIERTIQASWQHRVLFTDRVFQPDNPTLRQVLGKDSPGSKALVVVDDGLDRAQPELVSAISAYFAANPVVRLVGPPLVCQGGEAGKNSWTGVSELHAALDRAHIDRHSYLVAVGGGALLDVAGLAAATAHRGVRHVRIPTTTLSQCDSAIGVKNGINGFGKKNFFGTFAPPHAVINDFGLLDTLSPRDWRAGFAEAVKVACVRDGLFFRQLEADAAALCACAPPAVRRLIRRCAELHLNHIVESGDPFELGSVRPLDFGHWWAHKLESLSEFRLRHGEAVAIGIALDTLYSNRAGYLAESETERVLALLEVLGFELFAPELRLDGAGCEPRVFEGLEEFREHLGGRLVITLLRGVGFGFEVHDMDRRLLMECIRILEARRVKKIP